MDEKWPAATVAHYDIVELLPNAQKGQRATRTVTLRSIVSHLKDVVVRQRRRVILVVPIIPEVLVVFLVIPEDLWEERQKPLFGRRRAAPVSMFHAHVLPVEYLCYS